MNNSKKLITMLLLGALSIPPVLSAESQSTKANYLRNILSRVSTASTSAMKETANWILKHPIQTTAALVVLGWLGYGTFKYNRDRRTANPLSTILSDPATGLSDLSRISEQFSSTVKNHGLDVCSRNDTQASLKLKETAQHDTIQYYEKKSPIFLLRECTEDHLVTCPLSRTCKPKYREQFENRVVHELIAKSAQTVDPVQYVGFGCGGMYQDLVILCKTLNKKPDASLSIHLIDLTFVNVQFSLIDSMPAMVKLKGTTIQNQERQFISFLKKEFPKATLTLNLHCSKEMYFKHIMDNEIPQPDVICAADIDTNEGLDAYSQLCMTALQNNHESRNILLSKEICPKNKTAKARLVTISLDKANNSMQRHMKDLE